MGIASNQKAGQDAIANGLLVRGPRPAMNIGPPTPPLTNTNNLNPFLDTPLPAGATQQPDQQRQWQRGGVIPQERVMPLPPAANAPTGSTSASQAFIQTGPIQVQTTTNTAHIAQNTSDISNLQATSFQGAWSGGVTYSQGASVTGSDGKIYVSLVSANIGHNPTTDSGVHWQAAGTEVFLGAWNSGTAYVIGNVVSVSTQLFFALQNSTNQNPTSTSGFWQLLNPSAIAAWNSGTAYLTNQLVTNGGFVFSALQNSTNQTPPTPPATSVYWQNLGPASVDPSTSYVLAKGSVPTSLNNGLSYTSTTTSITLAWTGQAIYRSDGTITSIANGSQAVTGLGTGITYYAFPFYDEVGQTFGFISNSEVTFPSITGVVYASASSQEVTTTTSHALTAAFSIEFWTQIGSGSSSGGGVTVAPGQTGAISGATALAGVRWTAGQIAAFYRDSGGTPHTVTSPAKYNDGEFHHVVYTCDPTNSLQALYVDGVQVVTLTSAVAVSATTGWYRLSRDFANAFLTGTLTEVAVYNKALTAVQVGNHFTVGNTVSQSVYESTVLNDAPTIWWKSTETGGSTLADSGSIGSNTGNLVNSPTLNQSAPVFGAVGSPAILWPSRSLLVSQAQILQSRVPITVGGWAVATPSVGSGGGAISGSTGGSGDGCFSLNTLVQTPNGAVPISALKRGDFVISRDGVTRIVLELIEHEAKSRVMLDMGGGQLVTPKHLVYSSGWRAAGDAFQQTAAFGGPVFNLSIDAENFDDHSFLLGNGVLAHNAKLR